MPPKTQVCLIICSPCLLSRLCRTRLLAGAAPTVLIRAGRDHVHKHTHVRTHTERSIRHATLGHPPSRAPIVVRGRPYSVSYNRVHTHTHSMHGQSALDNIFVTRDALPTPNTLGSPARLLLLSVCRACERVCSVGDLWVPVCGSTVCMNDAL